MTPQDNIFATTPGLEQQARRSTFTFNVLAPIFYNSNADLTPSGGTAGQNSAEFSPDRRPVVGDAGLRPAAQVHGERARRGRSLHPGADAPDFDKIALSGRLQYIDPANDQAYSPYFVYAPTVRLSTPFYPRALQPRART